ncbi:homologous recombination OB-fold protein [Brachyhypopomus gauderio]|uniref:homologous recombination OB-fold protein n=1 Tax=Brachyhypopomus gauderio TaxID=698409 RepID=UPI004041478A
MTTTACNKWSGLFSVGDDGEDEDLLAADWIPVPASVSGPLVAPLPASMPGLSTSPAAVQDSGSPHVCLPEASPIRDIGRYSNCGLVSSTVPRVATNALRAPLGGGNVPVPLHPAAQPHPPPVAHSGLHTRPPPQDDFDDWDVDLQELEERVLRGADWPQPGSGLQPDSASPAKRMRTCTGRPLPQPQPCIRATHSPALGPRSNAPYQSPRCPPERSTSWRPVTVEPMGAPSLGQMRPATPQQPRRHPASLFQAVTPTPSPTLTPCPLHAPLLTNHVVQLVSAANKTPQRPRSDAVGARLRRFPGPAGALPQQLSGRSLDDIVVTAPQTPAHGAVARLRNEVPGPPVSEEEEFSGGVWAAMKAELGLDERNPLCFLHSYSIVMVLRKAALRQLSRNKVPNMAVVLKSIIHTHADAKAVFRDPTGEMQGTVHRRLLEDRQGELKTGAVLLLKQVGVFSPSHRNHYLNVTPNNLLRIYPPDGVSHASTLLTQPVLEPAGLLEHDSSRPLGGPVSQMELRYDEEDKQNEQTAVPANTTVPVQKGVQPSSGPEDMEQALWEADDLDELLWELPDSYST